MQRRILSKDSSKPYLIGVNYWASHAAHKMWEHWDPIEVEKDMALAQQMRLNAIRCFFWSPQLNPFPGVINEDVMTRFTKFLDICQRYEIGVFPTFFVGHMSGTNWDIPWRQGREFCADPYMVYWQTDLVSRIVARFKEHPAVLGWILTNELPNYTGSLAPETATMWTRAMYQAVKEADPKAIMGTGDGARCEVRPDYDGFRVEWIADHVDYFGVHLYNYFKFENGDNDELRKAYHIPCRLRYVDMGKPVFLEEFGLSDLMADAKAAAGYYRSILYSSWVNGACGALAWCLTDFELENEIPYLFQPHELRFGVATSKRQLKPQGQVLQEFATFARECDIHAYQMKQPLSAILVPYYMYTDRTSHRIDRLRTYQMLEQSFTMAKMAGLNPDFVRDLAQLDQYKVLFLPAGFRLQSPEWKDIADWVRKGGTLYVSYYGQTGGVYAQNFEELFGCRQMVKYGLLNQPEEVHVRLQLTADFGTMAKGDVIELARGPLGTESAYLNAEPLGGEVVAVDGHDRPALVCNQLGQGRVVFSTYPIEYMIMNQVNGNLRNQAYRIYASAAKIGGIEPRFRGLHTFLEVVVLDNGNHDLLVVINHAHGSVETTMHDIALGQELSIDLTGKGVEIFCQDKGKWRLFFQPQK
jgi:beta-galactosidase